MYFIFEHLGFLINYRKLGYLLINFLFINLGVQIIEILLFIINFFYKYFSVYFFLTNFFKIHIGINTQLAVLYVIKNL